MELSTNTYILVHLVKYLTLVKGTCHVSLINLDSCWKISAKVSSSLKREPESSYRSSVCFVCLFSFGFGVGAHARASHSNTKQTIKRAIWTRLSLILFCLHKYGPTLPFSLSLSLSLSPTLTHTHSHNFFPRYTQTHSLSLFS